MMEDERLKEVSKELIKEKNMKQERITYLVGSRIRATIYAALTPSLKNK